MLKKLKVATNPFDMRYFLYKTTCLVTNQYYIGIHATNRPNVKYYGSGILLKQSLRKHGQQNHKIEILQEVDTEQQLRCCERQIVTEEVLKDSLCMNRRIGGRGGFTEAMRSKSRNSFRKHLQDPNFRNHVSNTNSKKAIKRSELYREQNSRLLKERHKDPHFQQIHKQAVIKGNKMSHINRRRRITK